MTVSTAYAPLNYTGNGSTTVFSVTWPFFTGSLIVTLVSAAGVETVKTISTHYTVSGGTTADGTPATGSVTMLTAPASGETLRISRATPKLQSATWTNGAAFQAKTVEATVDRLMLIAQEGGGSSGGGGDPVGGDSMQFVSSGADPDYWDAEDAILRNLSDPVDDTDAVPKGYADDHYGGAAAATAVAAAAAAASSATNAATSATNAANAWDDFDDRYLGSKAADPVIDNDGDALEAGALYWNSALGEMRVYTGSVWNAWVETYAVAKAASRTELATLNPSLVSAAYLTQSYCCGMFRRVAYADYSTLVDADTEGIVAVRSTSNAAYAWLRDGASTDGSYFDVRWAMDTGDEDDIGPVVTRCKNLGVAMGTCGAAGAPGCVIELPPEEVAWETTLVALVSNMTLRGTRGATVVKLSADTAHNNPVMRAIAVPASVGSYVYENIFVEDIIFDASDVPYIRWCQKLDGTLVTDPDADYVMGTGVLASGVSGVSLTPVINGTTLRCDSVTINNRGTGFKGHPTSPYVPDNVRLRFRRVDGNPLRLPSGYATLRSDGAGGYEIDTITIQDPGLSLPTTAGYITVETAGGYADPEILYDPAVDRRNILATDGNGNGGHIIQMSQIVNGGVRRCKFIETMRSVTAQGFDGFEISDCHFHNCGDLGGIRWQTALIDYATGSGTTYGKNGRVIRNRFTCDDTYPSPQNGIACYLLASYSCELSHNYVERAPLAQISNSPGQSGRYIISYNHVVDCRGNQVIEGIDGGAYLIEGNLIDGCDGQAWGIYSARNVTLRNNIYRDMWRQTLRQVDFLSQVERATEFTGEMPNIFQRGGFQWNATDAVAMNGALIVGALGTVGADGWLIDGETLVDDRTSANRDIPALVAWFRSGGSSANLATRITIQNCRRTYDDSSHNAWIPFFAGDPSDDVMDAAYRLVVRNNPGHKSESIQVVSATYLSGASGVQTITCGFPPSRVTVRARATAAPLSTCQVVLSHDWDNAFGVSVIGDWQYAGSAVGGTITNKAFDCKDSGGVSLINASFTRWTKEGFKVTLSAGTDGATVYYICEP